MKQKLARLKNLANAALLSAAVSAGNVMAAVPTEADTVFTDLGTDAGTLIGKGWVVVGVVVGGLTLIKIFKKVVSRSS